MFTDIKSASNIKRNSFTISSRNRTTGNGSDFTYDLGVTLTDIRLITVNTVEFDQTIYNIRDFNNTFTFVSPLGVTNTITIPSSTYDIPRLIEELTNQIDSFKDGGVDFVVVFDEYEKLTIKTSKGVTSFGLDFGVTNSIGRILGISEQSFFGITSLTGSSPLNLVSDKNIFICSSALTTGAYDIYKVSQGVTNVLTKVYLHENFGGIVFDENEINIRNKIPSLSSIDINIRDERNNLVELNNGSIELTLDIYSRVFSNPFTI